MANQARKEQVRRAIREAFADVPYPADGAIALLSQDPDDKRAEEINRDFSGHHWRDLPDEVRDKHSFDYPPFTPEARRFYLPAYLLSTLDLIQRHSDDFWTLDALLPPENMDRFRRSYDGYTAAQKDAIRLYLEYMRDVACEGDAGHLAQVALARYWDTGEREAPRHANEPSRKEQVKQVIREAFADVAYPGDERIAYNEEGWLDLEEIEVRNDFRGYHWSEVTRAVLRYHYDSLPRLSAEGRHFYLPAYLFAALECDDDIRQWVVFDLTPSRPGELEEWKKSRNALLSPAQKAAVRRFLEYIGEAAEGNFMRQEEVRIALGSYWNRAEYGVPGGLPRGAVDHARKAQVEEAVREGFALIPYPLDPDMTPPEDKLDPHAKRFHGLPREVLIEKHRSLSIFEPERVRVYLPAYLLAAIDDLYDIVYRVVFLLEPRATRRSELDACYDGFSPAQQRAVRLFLEYVRDCMPETGLAESAQAALDAGSGRDTP